MSFPGNQPTNMPENEPKFIKPKNPAEICDLLNHFFAEADQNGRKVNFRMTGDKYYDRVMRFKCEVVSRDILKGEDTFDSANGPNIHRAARITYLLRDIWVPFVITPNYRYLYPRTATIMRANGKLHIDDNEFTQTKPWTIFGYTLPRPW